jgi:signal transduction histidine kinase
VPSTSRTHRPHLSSRASGRHGPRQSVTAAVGQFALTGLAAVALLGFVAVGILRHTGQAEAIRDAKHETQLAGEGIVGPQIHAGLLSGDPAEISELDRVVHDHVLRDPVIRVKIWDAAGKILYSDRHELIGSTYKLGADELAALHRRGIDAGISDLTKPENRLERPQGKMLEVYQGIRGPAGVPLLYEEYLSYSSVAASGNRLWSQFAPALLLTLALLELAQIPLAWSLARRLRRRQEERETLLRRAVEASEIERRRIARDLHDGVVQRLVGLSYTLSAAAPSIRDGQNPSSTAQAVDDAAKETRESIRELRSLLLEIYPPTLQRAGLAAALDDLVAPLRAREIATEIHLDPDLEIGPQTEPVLYRVAQEAVRNIAAHAHAGNARIRVTRENASAVLSVEDDGRGFVGTPGRRAEDKRHFGLRIIQDLADDAGGTLTVESKPGEGTRVRIEVPAR